MNKPQTYEQMRDEAAIEHAKVGEEVHDKSGMRSGVWVVNVHDEVADDFKAGSDFGYKLGRQEIDKMLATVKQRVFHETDMRFNMQREIKERLQFEAGVKWALATLASLNPSDNSLTPGETTVCGHSGVVIE